MQHTFVSFHKKKFWRISSIYFKFRTFRIPDLQVQTFYFQMEAPIREHANNLASTSRIYDEPSHTALTPSHVPCVVHVRFADPWRLQPRSQEKVTTESTRSLLPSLLPLDGAFKRPQCISVTIINVVQQLFSGRRQQYQCICSI